MMMIRLLIFVLAGWAANAGAVQAQEWRYVNSEYIMQNMDQYKAAQREIESLKEKWQQEVEDKRQALQTKQEKFEKKKPLLNESQRSKRREEIAELEKELKQFRQEHFGYKGKLYRLRREKMRPIYKEMRKAVKTVAEANRVEIVIDKASRGALLLYSAGGQDLSDEVLQELGVPSSDREPPDYRATPDPKELIYYGAGGRL
jgi:outer membrane protein